MDTKTEHPRRLGAQAAMVMLTTCLTDRRGVQFLDGFCGYGLTASLRAELAAAGDGAVGVQAYYEAFEDTVLSAWEATTGVAQGRRVDTFGPAAYEAGRFIASYLLAEPAGRISEPKRRRAFRLGCSDVPTSTNLLPPFLILPVLFERYGYSLSWMAESPASFMAGVEARVLTIFAARRASIAAWTAPVPPDAFPCDSGRNLFKECWRTGKRLAFYELSATAKVFAVQRGLVAEGKKPYRAYCEGFLSGAQQQTPAIIEASPLAPFIERGRADGFEWAQSASQLMAQRIAGGGCHG